MSNSPQSMACPVDSTPLVMSERQGIEIDYCPSCRGVWLDRGELDKIIERATIESPAQQAAPQQQANQNLGSDPYGYGNHGYGKHGYGKHGRRRSFLHDLFD